MVCKDRRTWMRVRMLYKCVPYTSKCLPPILRMWSARAHAEAYGQSQSIGSIHICMILHGLHLSTVYILYIYHSIHLLLYILICMWIRVYETASRYVHLSLSVQVSICLCWHGNSYPDMRQAQGHIGKERLKRRQVHIIEPSLFSDVRHHGNHVMSRSDL